MFIQREAFNVLFLLVTKTGEYLCHQAGPDRTELVFFTLEEMSSPCGPHKDLWSLRASLLSLLNTQEL